MAEIVLKNLFTKSIFYTGCVIYAIFGITFIITVIDIIIQVLNTVK